MSNNEHTFYRVCEMLDGGHGDPSGRGSRRPDRQTPIGTLNSLFKKHLDGHQQDLATDPPWLTPDNVLVSIEIWPKPKLRELTTRDESRLPHPAFMHLPVILVRYKGRDCLIDGGSRIHVWHESGDTSGYRLDILKKRCPGKGNPPVMVDRSNLDNVSPMLEWADHEQ